MVSEVIEERGSFAGAKEGNFRLILCEVNFERSWEEMTAVVAN